MQVCLNNEGGEDLVKVDYYVLAMQNIMSTEFVEKLYAIRDNSLLETKFLQYYISYEWYTHAYDNLRKDLLARLFFTIMHIINMQYINNRKCRVDEEDCESTDSIFAIYDGRRNPFVRVISTIELAMCAFLCFYELIWIYELGLARYNEDFWWNVNGFIMPTSYIVGFFLDKDIEASTWCRISYAITTMTLLFTVLKKLRLTDRFSFIVICIFKSLYEIGDYILFQFILLLFLTVSYSNLGYFSPYGDKFNIYIANFINMFKMAMGESQTDEILELDGALYYFGWILFVFFAFFTTIVYMNILIAVVSDQFVRIYERKDYELNKRRLPYVLKMRKDKAFKI
jgi:hypothetical protein